MPYPKGGRADKNGNRYETRWVIHQMLKVIEEEIVSVQLEAIGEDEEGIDLWITFHDGSREGQQCKGRNASKEEWDISSLKSKSIIKNWKKHLDRCNSNKVSLVSPLSCQMLEDLIDRANNTNNNPEDFLKYQIEKSGKKFMNFFYGYCNQLNLNPKVNVDLYKIIDYLKRTAYHQAADDFMKENIRDKIQYLFIGDKNIIYNCLENLVLEGNILSKEITNSYLRGYLKDNNIVFKNIALDTKIAPRIAELNEEYKEAFLPIDNKLLFRNEFELCTNSIKNQESIIIHGKAGSGKSGCTQAIISFCERNKIPYIAIKLDKRIPSKSAEKWGEDLGLPTSITHSLHSISKSENAVIILDQLDALRWTQAHSRDALIICSEIIRQVISLNLERNRKISIVLVCRTYDLDNDKNIRLLFRKKEEKRKFMEWIKIHIGGFDEATVRNVVGKSYGRLSKKLKSVLQIPSNLYIWQHLDRGKTYDDFSTANELIYEWWNQLLEKCVENEVDQQSVQSTKENIVDTLDKYGRLSISCKLLSIIPRGLDYLASSGFITLINNNVSFTHQSILDYFLVEKMLQRYFKGESIISIIGAKENQTPGKRYQIQMLLQNIQEHDFDNFVHVGKQMLESSDVRFYVKYVFLEVLGQSTSINFSIKNFILQYCKKKEFENHIVGNVIYGHPIFVELLLENGVLDRWMQDKKKKDIAINLMVNLCPKYSENDIAFIKKYVFISEDDDRKLFRCFSLNVQEDTDEMFELKMEFYQHHPELIDSYIDFEEMFQNCEVRAVRILEFLLNNKKRNIKDTYRYKRELIDKNSKIILHNGRNVVEKLLPYIPREKGYYNINSEWDGRYDYNNGFERSCVELVKKANVSIINNNPQDFIEIYKEFFGKGYVVFNEIILDGLEQFSIDFSDIVVNYIITNFDENIFDKTSGNEDELALVKAILRKYTPYCSEDVFLLLENVIMSYIDPNAKEWYKRRIEYNKNKENGNEVYWSFWGDMQMAILPCLPSYRISGKAKNLLKVLNRRFKNVANKYIHWNGHGGGVSSPIERKKLGNKQWLKILINNKLNTKNSLNCIEVKDGFIESSIEMFSSSFRGAVSAEPERFIRLLLGCDSNIPEIFIDSLFNGVTFSNKLNDISTDLLEKMILKYHYNYDSFRAESICYMIEKKENADWSQNIIDILNDVAINHSNPNNEKPNITSDKDKEMKSFDMLQKNAFNCIRGNASRAIGHLLWNNKVLYECFKETVSKLCDDINPAVRLANLYALSPIYNIDRKWATEKILYTFERDYRMAGYRGARQLFFRIYPKFRERVLKIILKCYSSNDKDLIKIGAYGLSELYIRKGEFKDYICDVKNMNETQVKSIVEMALHYLNKEPYTDLVKDLIEKYKSSKFDLEFPLARIFYDNLIDLKRDEEFLIEVMKSNISRRLIHYFVCYLEENSKSIIEYNEIILSMSYSLIENKDEDSEYYWEINDELSKLIIGLYDEVSQLPDEESKSISQQCLDIWDLMFEKRIGSARSLSQQIIDR